MKELFEIFIVFFRIGLFTFGGGYAMLPLIEREVVGNKKWATKEDMTNYIALSQCTPGVLAVNCATFVGYKKRKFLGSVFATIGVVLPSVIIITIIATFISNFAEYEITKRIFAGVRICVGALIINTVINLCKSNVKDFVGLVLFVLGFLATLFFSSPVICIVISLIVGLLVYRGGDKN